MDPTITAALFGVIGTLLGAWAGSAISRKSVNDLAREKARLDFARAFIPTLEFFHSSGSGEKGFTIDTLKKNYPDYYKAYRGYRHQLPGHLARILDDRWKQFTNEDDSLVSDERVMYRFSDLNNADTFSGEVSAAIAKIEKLIGPET